MWSTADRLAQRDAYEPNEHVLDLDCAAAYALGDTVDSAPSSVDVFDGLNPYFLAAARTDADAEELAVSFEAGLAAPAPTAEVVDLATRRRRAPAIPTGLRAA